MAKRETDEITIPAVAVDAFNEAVQQVAPNNQSTPTGKIFSETDVENIRKQEKDKMYKRLEEADARAKTMEEQLKVITGEREKRGRQERVSGKPSCREPGKKRAPSTWAPPAPH